MSDSLTNENYLTMRELRSRGWTERLVGQYLRGADLTSPNPHVASARPQRLFLTMRVVAIELNDPGFRKERDRSAYFSARSRYHVSCKRELLEGLVRGFDLPRLEVPFERLMSAANKKRFTENIYWNQTPDQLAIEISLDSMKALEWHLDGFVWHSGVCAARRLLRRRMLAHIIDHYPALAEACRSRAAVEDGSAGSW